MPKRIALTNLNARTIDIMNTIRANASAQYQDSIPEVTTEHDLPQVGEYIVGYPAMANEFVTALLNRIAQVRVKSAIFNNAYAKFKKGYLEFGETVEEVFVQITKARAFRADKAASREFKRTIPDVKTAFHIMNYRVQYPATIQNEDLRRAFTSFDALDDFIARIISNLTTAAEYDEYLLCKYLLIKGCNQGAIKVETVTGDNQAMATAFRAMSNKLPFLSDKYNEAGVITNTPKADQYIIMDAAYNAEFDVDVLSAAFNMDKAEYLGKLELVDDFTSFDNERFAVIRGESDQIETVTDAELANMANVKAILIDQEWFQLYDNLTQMTENYVASGLYWNYYLNVWKTVSFSPFSNAVAFVQSNS